jgi:hypothetical protein
MTHCDLHLHPYCVDPLHDDTPARLIATATVARLSAGENGLGLNDG